MKTETQAQTPQDFASIWDKKHISKMSPSQVRHKDLQNYLSKAHLMNIGQQPTLVISGRIKDVRSSVGFRHMTADVIYQDQATAQTLGKATIEAKVKGARSFSDAIDALADAVVNLITKNQKAGKSS